MTPIEKKQRELRITKDSKTIERFLKWANKLGFSEALKQDASLLTGWICPRCGKVHSPFSTNCDCPPQSFTSTGTSTGTTLEQQPKEGTLTADMIHKIATDYAYKRGGSEWYDALYAAVTFGAKAMEEYKNQR